MLVIFSLYPVIIRLVVVGLFIYVFLYFFKELSSSLCSAHIIAYL